MGFLGCLLKFAAEPLLLLLPVLRRRELMLGDLRWLMMILCGLIIVSAWADGQEMHFGVVLDQIACCGSSNQTYCKHATAN